MVTKFQQALLSQAGNLENFEDWNGEELADMVFDWVDEGVQPNPQSWMDTIFPYEGPPPANMAIRESLHKWFRCHPIRALKAILEHNMGDDPAPIPSRRFANKMTREWRGLMKMSTISLIPIINQDKVWNLLGRPDATMRHVITQEVRDTDQGKFAAAGPDGVDVLDWEEVPPVVRAVFFNLVLANNCFGYEALQHRAVFISEFDEEDNVFFEFVALPNAAVRQLHRILLMRLNEELGVDNRRRLNLMLIASVLHQKTPFMMAKVVFYRAYASLKQDAVCEALRRVGATMLADYLAASYRRTTVLFEYGHPGKMRRGIPLGDPLSEIILTMVLDQLLVPIVKISAIHLGSLNLTALVLGDEVLLFGTKMAELQAAVEVLQKAAFGVGLEVDLDECLVAGAFCQPPEIILGGKVLDQMVDGDHWRCFGRLFNGGRFLSPVKVLREYTEAICESELDSNQFMKALNLMVNEYLDAEVFFTAPSVGELRTIDNEIVETACRFLYENNTNSWKNISDYCGDLTTVEKRAPMLLKNALEDLDEWRKYVRRNSQPDWCTSFIINSRWLEKAWQLANVCDSSYEGSDSDF